jgi:nitrate reductase NapE component
MKFETASIIEKFKNKFRHSEHSSFTSLTLEKDWKKFLILWFCLFLILIVSNVFIFLRVMRGEQVTGETSATTTDIIMFDVEDLEFWSTEISQRQAILRNNDNADTFSSYEIVSSTSTNNSSAEDLPTQGVER